MDTGAEPFVGDHAPSGAARKVEKRLLNARWSLGRQIRTCRMRGKEIRIGVSSGMERFRCNTYALKEPDTIERLAGTVRPRDVIFAFWGEHL